MDGLSQQLLRPTWGNCLQLPRCPQCKWTRSRMDGLSQRLLRPTWETCLQPLPRCRKGSP
ncbi:unnamed protein product [Polarella glacialis]|uniref:Uncharacterized protein n=1 Tax=Polarella glacialis TaxID=89957 RepID=A0A813GL21_POLGL|nr:unnamed protein product [Polarella glacialis]